MSDGKLTIQCTGCSQTLRFAASSAGQNARCPNCGTVIQLPPLAAYQAQPTYPPAPQHQPQMPAAPSSMSTSAKVMLTLGITACIMPLLLCGGCMMMFASIPEPRPRTAMEIKENELNSERWAYVYDAKERISKSLRSPSTAEFECDIRNSRLEGDYATVTGNVTAVNGFNAPITSSFRVIYLRAPMKPIEVTFDGETTVLDVAEKMKRDEVKKDASTKSAS